MKLTGACDKFYGWKIFNQPHPLSSMIAPELEVSYAQVVREQSLEKWSWWSLWRGLSWKPIYATAIVLIGIALILGVLFLKRRADKLEEARKLTANDNLAAASQSPTPDHRASTDPSPPAPPNELPVEKALAMVVLRDCGSMVTVDSVEIVQVQPTPK